MPPPPTAPVSPDEVCSTHSSFCCCSAVKNAHTQTDVLLPLLLQLEFFAEEELIQIVPNCSVPDDYIDGVLVR